jgi:hypothetical protein
MTALDLISQVLDLSRVCDVVAGLKTIMLGRVCSFGLFGLSGLSCVFRFSELRNKTNQIDQTNQTDQYQAASLPTVAPVTWLCGP